MVKAQKPISMEASTIEEIDRYSKTNDMNFSEAAEVLIIKGLKSKEGK